MAEDATVIALNAAKRAPELLTRTGDVVASNEKDCKLPLDLSVDLRSINNGIFFVVSFATAEEKGWYMFRMSHLGAAAILWGVETFIEHERRCTKVPARQHYTTRIILGSSIDT